MFKSADGTKIDSLIFLAQQVLGSSLLDISRVTGGYPTAKSVIGELWRALPEIHRHWGFCGSLDSRGIYYDCTTRKITILNWDRGQLPIVHSLPYSQTDC